MSQLQMFRIDDGATHWFASYTADEALNAWKELYGFSDDEIKDLDPSVELVPPSTTLRVRIGDDTAGNLPAELVDIDGVAFCVAPVAAWVAVAQPNDIICSTEY
jgi:hypothetical protein